ncbi:SWI/SNF and RSC complex subunit Ssr3 [Schizosaccharomyces octosporus yFS286]|uniref:SWI/SNF and RSC complex subunit Ssr3 n=1 Tax=Schizosaccharomyces octosporus (strain yFS286) TaxID=483514 RepID=S9Q3H3_SCHOY|nr:SWI/SNF and RSC complex subunit Ssr3 [Schizosaccharomyces octosporus yFS286]EPX74602.1 SWI/SNF and RSC complex subunit Ssr3 [Schizosaccharomyces octosporus yFS286]
MSGNPNLSEKSNERDTKEASEVKKEIRLLEREIPEKLLETILEANQYVELQELERRLDSLIVRKRFDLQDSLSRQSKKTRAIRIFIRKTLENQAFQSHEEKNDIQISDLASLSVPSWTIHMEGRLIPGKEEEMKQLDEIPFTTFFKKIAFQIQRSEELYPESNYVEWNKLSNGTNLANELKLKRNGDQNVKINILLYPDEHPERYKLSSAFANLLAIKEGTRPTIVTALWQYIKFHRLQDMEEKRLINCDKGLRNLFETDRLYFPRIPELMNRFLEPVDPIVLSFELNVNEESDNPFEIFDVFVNADDPKQTQTRSFLANVMNQNEIKVLDEKISSFIEAIHYSKSKYDFMRQFSEDPVMFIHRWTESQSKDLEVILDGSETNFAEKKDSKYYQQPWIEESAIHYLNRLNSKKQQEILNASTRK